MKPAEIPEDSKMRHQHQNESLQNSKTPETETSDRKPPVVHAVDFNSMLSMDEIVRLSLINDNWKIVESKRSRMISTLRRNAVKSLAPPFNFRQIQQEVMSSWTSRIEQQRPIGRAGFPSKVSVDKKEIVQSSVGSANKGVNDIIRKNDSFDRKVAPPTNQSHLKEIGTERHVSVNFESRESLLNGHFDFSDDIDKVLYNIASKKKKQTPLPDFDDLNSDDDDNVRRENGFHNSDQWSMKEKGTLCMYENLVGVDLRRPLFMFVPQSLGNDTPRIGEIELDKLSELSENDSKSDMSPELRSDLEEDPPHPKRSSLLTTDSSIQTENPSPGSSKKEIGTMTAADIVAEIKAERSKSLRVGLLSGLLPSSSEPNDVDPKFVQRPTDCIEILEGEMISVRCRLSGTEPIDVFWFRDMAEEVTQLEDNGRCDIERFQDTFTLDLFNASMADAGQYLCIGVNAKGHTIHGFQIKILENRGSKFAASILDSPQSVEVLQRSEATLSCRVAGYPPPRVLWYRGEDRLRNGEKYRIESSADGSHQLIIHDVGEFSTEYLVLVRNVLNETKATVKVRVKKDDSKEKRKKTFRNDQQSPYPDLEELVEIAQKSSPLAKDAILPNSSVRFTSRSQNQCDEESLKKNQQTLRNAAKGSALKQDWMNKSHSHAPLPSSLKGNGDFSDDELELCISYKDFERLFDAKLITRSQLHSGRVWKRDLEKIQNFLRENNNSIAADSRFSEAKTDDPHHFHVDCGLKKINSEFYHRDYFVGELSKSSRLLDSNTEKLHAHTAHKSLHASWPQVTAKNLQVHENADMMQLVKEESTDLKEAVSNVHQEEGVTLPCVKELRSKFSSKTLSPETSLDDISPLKRIYSLTGRSVPEFVRDRIQRRLSSNDPLEKEELDLNERTPTKDKNISIFQSTNDSGNNLVSRSISCDSTTELKIPLMRNSVLMDLTKEQDGEKLKIGKQSNNHAPVLDKAKVEKQIIKQGFENSIRNDIVRPPNKPVDTVVVQRAAYWDKRILNEQPSDPFPEMIN